MPLNLTLPIVPFLLAVPFSPWADFPRLCNGSLSWNHQIQAEPSKQVSLPVASSEFLCAQFCDEVPTQTFHRPSAHLSVCLTLLACRLVSLPVPNYLTSYIYKHWPLSLLSSLVAVVLLRVILHQQHSPCSELVEMPAGQCAGRPGILMWWVWEPLPYRGSSRAPHSKHSVNAEWLFNL